MKDGNLLLQRFQGFAGRRHVRQELCKQAMIGGDKVAALALARVGKVCFVQSGQMIISQGAATNDVFFILCGKLKVKRHNRELIDRGPGECVGEMAMLDASQPRCATVIASENTIVLQVSATAFTKVACANPELWRYLALQQAHKLRQRLAGVRPRNDTPIVFIGSSKESVKIAKAVKVALASVAEVRIWTEGVFQGDQFTLESIEKQAGQVDYAVMVFGPDDRVFSRGRTSAAPRDNVVFELGVFVGALGRKRAFVIKPSKKALKLPSDLLGKNHLEYSVGAGKPLRAAVRAASLGLIDIIKREGAL